jgi:hypothetical protein
LQLLQDIFIVEYFKSNPHGLKKKKNWKKNFNLCFLLHQFQISKFQKKKTFLAHQYQNCLLGGASSSPLGSQKKGHVTHTKEVFFGNNGC